MKNLEIAKILDNIADLLELQGVEFKPRAYRNAARGIENLSEDIADVYQRGELEEIPGVGKSIAEKIAEYLDTGKLKYYGQLKKQAKVDVEELNLIPGLGPKKIKLLYDRLKIKNINDLEKAIKQHKLKQLPGFGEETEQNFLRGIQFVKAKPHRFLYAQAQPIVEEICSKFSKYPFVKKIEIAGSFRRGKETVGDLDLLAVSDQPEKVMQLFTSLPDLKEVLAHGPAKSSIRLTNNLQIDLRVVKEKEWGSALMYFIGNKDHNIKLRKLALSKGYTLSEYGLFKVKGKKWLAGRTEEEIYRQLNLNYIPPEMRENNGEIEASQQQQLPKLIAAKDIQGIFHNHSRWSDGSHTLLEMAQAAEKMGFKFISFNDHYGPIGITNPLDEKRLKGYLKEIEAVRKKTNLRIFSGIEVDILKDGTLPLPKSKLSQLDVVIAAVHLSTKMPEAAMTSRVCAALENYPINILAHPTNRLLNSREGIQINLEKVFQAAKANKVFLEINAAPERMDLSGENIRAALSLGCKFALSTDAHDLQQLRYYNFGVNLARRGWLGKNDILNCWDLSKIEKMLKR